MDQFPLPSFIENRRPERRGKKTPKPRTSQLCSEGNLLAVSMEAGVGYGFLVLITLLVSVLAGDHQV